MNSDDVIEVPVEGTIRLGQLLKLANLAEDGASAKELIEDSLVTVNGDVETRRGRQLRNGDNVATPHGSARLVAAG
ncbi:RNA-binding S4 domain-containing protein [Arthrobacter pigmenti]